MSENDRSAQDAIGAEHRVTTVEQLEGLYGTAAGRAVTKEVDYITQGYRALIEASPFVLLATVGPEGTDCTPRGDPPGFVRVVDERTLLMPDRRGNNRLDNLRNIVRDGRLSLLFLIPGVGETLRVNGRGEIVTDPELCAGFEMQGKSPASVLVVRVETVYFQCQKALTRSRLWDPSAHVDRKNVPTAGDLTHELDREFDGKTYDAEYHRIVKETIY